MVNVAALTSPTSVVDDGSVNPSTTSFEGFARRLLPVALTLALATGCKSSRSFDPFDRCAAQLPSRLAQLPTQLSATGLFADVATGTLAPDVHTFEPSFALWSDGAEKRRWIWIPPGTTIDATDPDDWSFPVGTKFWKEFSRDGVRVETRLLQRVGPLDDDWVGVA